MFETHEIPIQQINSDLFKTNNIEVFVKREDLIHEEISGNKWRKLKYNILKAKEDKRSAILTFGGAYSNHIAATAAAGKKYDIKTVGIIRGEELNQNSNKTLEKAAKNGMELHFISRENYKLKDEYSCKQSYYEKFGNVLIIPEGGSNFYGIQGCMEIVDKTTSEFHYIVSACGTGSTISGITLGLKNHQKSIGVPVLKGDFLKKEIEIQIKNSVLDSELAQYYFEKLTLFNDFHFGGYAKWNDELIDFIRDFHNKTNIKLDPVYTGKMMFGLYEKIKNGYFKSGSKILAIHTGGLQGINGFEEKNNIKLFD